MNPTTMAAISLFVSSTALATDLQLVEETVLEGAAGTWTERGVGAAAVAWIPEADRYVMIFETRLPDWYASDPSCPTGLWALGRAWSEDGTSWDVDSEPFLVPEPGTYYSCVAAHPTVLWDRDDQELDVWFKAEQASKPCLASAVEPSWGCQRFSGVGHAVARLTDPVATADPEPAIAVHGQTFGFPSVVEVGGKLSMTLVQVPSVYLSVSDDGVTWSDPLEVLSPEDSPWAEDRMVGPVLACDDAGPQDYRLFVGGKRLGTPGLQSWGRWASRTAWRWHPVGQSRFARDNAGGWSHWDILRLREPAHPEHYLVWFSHPGPNGRRIGLASTDPGWDPADTEGKYCTAGPVKGGPRG